MVNIFQQDELVGAVGFESNRSSIISKGIRLRTKSEFSHVFIVIGRLGNRYLILEADENDVDVHLLDKYLTPNHRFQLYSPRAHSALISVALSQVCNNLLTEPYSYPQILGFLTNPLKALIAGKESRVNRFKKGYICSEVGAVYASCLNMALPFEDLNYVSPQDLLSWVKSSGLWAITAGSDYGSTELVRVNSEGSSGVNHGK